MALDGSDSATQLSRAIDNYTRRLREEPAAQRWKPDTTAKHRRRVAELLTPFAAIEGASAQLRRIAQASTYEDCGDHLAVVQCALALRERGYLVTVEPDGRKGPDLSIKRDGAEARVEVRRIREAGEKYMIDPRHSRPAPDRRTVVFWGNAEAAANKVIDSIKDKLRQVAQGSAIVLVVCEDPAIDCEDFEDAIEQLKRDVENQLLSLPEGLQYAVMAERFEEGGNPRVRVSRLAAGNLPDWTDDLRTLRLPDTHDLRDNPKRG